MEAQVLPSWSQHHPWIYFLTGALLPSLAYFVSQRSRSTKEANRQNKGREKNASDDDTDEDDEDLEGIVTTGPSSKWGYMNCPYKMVFCVNTELKMGKGKIAAQCCHAAVACYKRASKQCPAAVKAWEMTGCAKIALRCPGDSAELQEIAAAAIQKDIPMYLVCDAGRTQIAAGSRTVLGLGPAPVSVFEGVSDHLKLM